MKLARKRILSITAAAIAIAGLGQLSVPAASAETSTGWIGGTPPVNGTVYLHSSTINNVPRPLASSIVYTSFGTQAPAGTMGAMARLFREGALCSATDYLYNAAPNSSQNVATSRDCGAGWYNSHGFVAVWNGTSYSQYVTFPSSALQYPAPAAAPLTAPDAPSVDIPSGTNSEGQSFGSGAEVTNDADLPDLVSAIGVNGIEGYVRSQGPGKVDSTMP